MLSSSRHLALGRMRSTLLALAVLGSGCEGSNHSDRCNVLGLGTGQMDETYASDIAIVDRGDGSRLLYAAGGYTKQWHPIDDQGHVGPPLGRARSDYYISFVGQWTHAVFPWDSGFRVLRDDVVEYVLPDQPVQKRSYSSAGSPLPASFKVVLPFSIHGDIYLIWTAQESVGPPATWLAGLGRLEADERVVPIGEPFLRTTLTPNSFDFFIPGGGWDEQAGHFWIDHPDQLQVLKVSLDGTLLGAEPIVGDASFPYLRNWAKLPSGRWAAQHFGWWLTFTPTQRWKNQARAATVPANSVGQFTEAIDDHGLLWIAGTGNEQVSIRRYDDATSVLGEPTQSPLSVLDCELFLSTY